MDSTSRPTYPTSVNFEASTFRNGEFASLASRRAISVLPDARRPNHDDVLGNDFFGKFGGKFLPPHAVAQGDRHGALGSMLPDHVLIEFGDNLARSQFIERDLFFVGGCR